ncbi:DUF2061 domain-containing protein [Photobacterium sp. DA100]|uniref:DUF2061 domain-containing protein n=1 Tax=Photobacterium sp. DA100 TaxID=3027472 RepID=UPI002478BFA1|nr:DUF2061 domain-containing protein [Photobacterium sp. DA100]WEM41956.1 DUF2061 domain-containing protein [Photobacterium sp. DA100]
MKKTVSFAVIHFFVAFSIAYLLTGEILISSLIAMIEPMVNTVAFYFHEKAWQHKALIRSGFANPGRKTASFAVVHFSVAFGVAYLLTSDVLVGSVMAMIEPAINTVAYYFHERIWQKKSAQQAAKEALGHLACHHGKLRECADVSDITVDNVATSN